MVALVGDGAMQMNNMAELITVAEILEATGPIPAVVCVFNNQDLNQVTWEQRVLEGNPQIRGLARTSPMSPTRKFAELIGLEGIFVDDPKDLGAAWDEALAADRPVVLEVHTDPEIAPLPPHVSFAEARKFLSSVSREKGALHTFTDTASRRSMRSWRSRTQFRGAWRR